MYTYVYKYIYIYIERERDIDIEREMYIYIYIYYTHTLYTGGARGVMEPKHAVCKQKEPCSLLTASLCDTCWSFYRMKLQSLRAT